MSQDIKITRYSSEYKEQLIEFLAYLWQTLDFEKRKKKFEAKHEFNPYINHPLAYIALDGKTIVGFRGFVVQKFKINDKAIFIGSPTDLVVHPEYRRKGIFLMLITYSLKDISQNNLFQLFLNLSSNKYSTKGYLKLGWESLGCKENMYKISILNFLKYFFALKEMRISSLLL